MSLIRGDALLFVSWFLRNRLLFTSLLAAHRTGRIAATNPVTIGACVTKLLAYLFKRVKLSLHGFRRLMDLPSERVADKRQHPAKENDTEPKEYPGARDDFSG